MTPADLAGRATITVPEAGELLGISRGSAYRAAEAGSIPTLTLGKRLLVPVPKLLAMLEPDPSTDATASRRALALVRPGADPPAA